MRQLQRERAENHRLESAPVLQSIFDGITDGILVIDSSYRVIMFNKAIQKFMEKSSEEIVGNYCYYLCHSNNHVCNDCQAPSVFENSSPPSRIRVCFKENLERQFEIWNFPIKNEDGEVDYMIEYIKDITDRQEMEKDLLQAQRLAIIGEVTAKTAHEIRNPLNAMEGAAHYLLDEYKDDQKIQKYLELIKEQISRLNKVTSDLLSAARPRLAFSKRELINSVLLKSVDLVNYLARDKKIDINIFLDEALPEIRFDEARIQQVFVNLLRNSCDAIENKGRIEIVGHKRQMKGEDFVEISIIDDGIGIPKTDPGKVFDSFFTTKKNGTGLGLSIVKDIMKSHGGYVYIENNPGGGTTASIGLPAR